MLRPKTTKGVGSADVSVETFVLFEVVTYVPVIFKVVVV